MLITQIYTFSSSSFGRNQHTKTRGHITRASLHCGHCSNCNYTLGRHQPLSAPPGRRGPLIFDPYIPIRPQTPQRKIPPPIIRLQFILRWLKNSICKRSEGLTHTINSLNCIAFLMSLKVNKGYRARLH